MSEEKRVCHVTGKTGYMSPSDARGRMRRRRDTNSHVTSGGAKRRPHARLRVYLCQHCHYWHMANPEKS